MIIHSSIQDFSGNIENRICVERASKLKSPHAFLRWGDFQARSRFDRSTNPEEKWGLLVV